MDSYTQETKLWLDRRYKHHDEYGIYFAHQPIYGFLKGHCEPEIILRYIITFQIMNALSHLRFNSLLDVGGAEGYKAYIIKKLFDITTKSTDLSEEACKRAKEIFDIKSIPADIHNLPFKDEEFDVVLCSETLEHARETRKAIEELLRIARRAVVITVPNEPIEVVEQNIKRKISHAHIHTFTNESLNFLTSKGYQVLSRKIINPLTQGFQKQIEDVPKAYYENEDNLMILKKIADLLIRFDDSICQISSRYLGILFIVLKDIKCYVREAILDITPERIMNFSVPYYFINPMLRELSLDLLLSEAKEEVMFNIDTVFQDENIIEISGWAYIKGKSSENSKVRIILSSGRKYYFFDTISEKRPDVTASFKTLNLDDSGFLTIILKKGLAKDEYKVSIYIMKDDTKGLRLTNTVVKI